MICVGSEIRIFLQEPQVVEEIFCLNECQTVLLILVNPK